MSSPPETRPAEIRALDSARASSRPGERPQLITILGNPDIRQKITGGVHGDIGTVAMTVNTIPRAIEAAPGVKIMRDLGVPACVS